MVSLDTDSDTKRPVPLMRSDKRSNDSDVRGAIDALADRVDMLAAIVRETAGSLSASRGEVASLDRRVQERIGEDTSRSAVALDAVRGEIDALRSFVAEAPTRSETVVAAASDPLKETVSTLADRVETLAEVVRSTSGRLVAEQGRIAILTEALEKGDEGNDARFAEIRRSLQVISEQAARQGAASPPPVVAVDPELEDRVGRQVGALADRIDFLSGTVAAATGKIAAKDGEIAKLGQASQEATNRTSELVRSMRADLEGLKGRLEVDPLLQERVGGLVNTVETLGDRVGTLSSIVSETVGRKGAADPGDVSALDERLTQVGTRIDDVAAQLQQEIDALAAAGADGGGTPFDPSAFELQVAELGNQLGKLGVVVDDASGAVEQMGIELREEIVALAEVVQRDRINIGEITSRTNETIRAMRADLELLKERVAVDPGLEERVNGLVDTVQVIGDRVGALSGIVGETAGNRTGREDEIAAIDDRLVAVGERIDTVATELRREIDALTAVAPGGLTPVATSGELDLQVASFGEQLARLEVVAEDASGAAEQVGLELRNEIGVLSAAVERERIDLDQATAEWEARRAALEERMDELAAFATSTERGTDEIGKTLHTLADRLERLEHDRQAVASDATHVESAWALERIALESRLDEIAAAITEERPQAPEVGLLIDELAGRLARMEGERETVADLAALAETWTSELAALEARVDEGLSTLEGQVIAETNADFASVDVELVESIDELTSRIEQIERDRDAVRDELARTAASWAMERASLQERVSELAARIVTGPVPTAGAEEGDGHLQSPQELDRLRIGVEGLRMRLAYHEKTVSDLAGSRGVIQRLDELSARLDQLAAIVAAGHASTGGTVQMPMSIPVGAVQGVETAGLMSRLEQAERVRHETREKMLEQMEKIASRMDWRLQRLEAGSETPAGVN